MAAPKTNLSAGPVRTGFPFGLFSVLSLSEGAGRWQGSGGEWLSINCEPAHGIGGVCLDEGEETPGLPKEFDGGLSTSQADVFTVMGSLKCSPVGLSPEEAQSRALEHL